MIKVLSTLTLALFAVSFNAHAASHGGAAPMKAEAASAPASGAKEMKKEEKAAAKEMKKDDKAMAKEVKKEMKEEKKEMKDAAKK